MTNRVIAAVAIGILGSFGPVSTAHADTNDAKFISALRSEGITEQIPADYAIEAAHTVCENLDTGKSPKEMATEMVGKAGMTAYSAGYFVGASIEDYCPKHLPKLNGSSSGG
ncbi:DUF732 domain-containing protein [Mycobacterium vicinigordonae]|uniref:DUF732 domain-containing protein n=1 Tax=Mycobacterium vicinigordonae TaxID=1719132 RepID=A0A7D6DXM2_9MYCO|nr:DUF732 domain-containing protein [Mycobacterium vicinigordonae]QLL07008.1 DUF732 domain-containing protein [Mycobacterium vicinigordonae]